MAKSHGGLLGTVKLVGQKTVRCLGFSISMHNRQIIYINGRFLTQRITGVQRYGREVLLALNDEIRERAELTAFRWVLLVPQDTSVPELSSIDIEVLSGGQGNLWEQWALYWKSRRSVLVNFASTGPLLHRNQLITVHDAAVYQVPDAYNWRFRLWYKVMVNWIVRRSKSCFVVSEFAKSECIQFFGAKRENICVCTEGWQHLDRITPISDVEVSELVGYKPYVLAVSSPTPNKNFSLVVDAMKRIGKANFHFVVAGSVNPSIFAGTHELSESSKYLGYVSDEQLKGLYRNAACFVFPSRYEGFGIPPLEAMSMGCPVVASEIAPVKEVCGDAATYFDPSNAEQLAKQLVEITSDPTSKERWGAKGLERAQNFSWQKAASLVANHLLKHGGLS
jgi:glycosyltransferase involved in cell wall biosynthesis